MATTRRKSTSSPSSWVFGWWITMGRSPSGDEVEHEIKSACSNASFGLVTLVFAVDDLAADSAHPRVIESRQQICPGGSRTVGETEYEVPVGPEYSSGFGENPGEEGCVVVSAILACRDVDHSLAFEGGEI